MASQSPNLGNPAGLYAKHHKEVLSGAVNSDPILLEAHDRIVSVGVAGITTGARIEFTLDTHAAIEADTALWASWASGDVTANKIETLAGPVTGVRGVSLGAATWFMLIGS